MTGKDEGIATVSLCAYEALVERSRRVIGTVAGAWIVSVVMMVAAIAYAII